eukprot:jgi/Botrbrau1/6104/Bobra.331_2s0001.1
MAIRLHIVCPGMLTQENATAYSWPAACHVLLNVMLKVIPRKAVSCTLRTVDGDSVKHACQACAHNANKSPVRILLDGSAEASWISIGLSHHRCFRIHESAAANSCREAGHVHQCYHMKLLKKDSSTKLP